MRRSVLLASLVLVLPLSGCAQEDDSAGSVDPSTSSSASTEATSDPTRATETAEAAGTSDTFADVADPATMAVPARGMDALDALADVKVWEGSDFIISDQQVTVGLVREDNSEVVVALQSDRVLAEPSSREEMDYWLEYTQMAERPREVDPVVVDGVEMLRAQGTNGFAFIDHFVRGNGDLTATIDFVLPLDMSKAEREEYVGQVMATVQLAPELL
jgi:hypothetical protein